jgi:hypothetical protein
MVEVAYSLCIDKIHRVIASKVFFLNAAAGAIVPPRPPYGDSMQDLYT